VPSSPYPRALGEAAARFRAMRACTSSLTSACRVRDHGQVRVAAGQGEQLGARRLPRRQGQRAIALSRRVPRCACACKGVCLRRCGLTAIQLPVADRLGQVRGGDRIASGQVGDGARHAQDAVQGARRQAQAVDGVFQQRFVARLQAAVAQGLAVAELAVGAAGARQLALPRLLHPGAHGGAAFAGGGIGAQRLWRQARYVHVQVDAVQQRTGDARAVAADAVVAAAATAAGVAGPAAGAGVHRCDQLEAGRELGAARGPRDGDRARFQRLAQHFQRMPVPFGRGVAASAMDPGRGR